MGLLAHHGHVDEAIKLLRTRADSGHRQAARQLVELLAQHGHLDELRAEVDAGTPGATFRYLHLLSEQGQSEQAEQLRRWGSTQTARSPR